MGKKGFSLIELMIVVGIIAVLSTIAIPSYKTFQAKARQKGGFNLLNTFYSAAQSTRAEIGIFPGNLVGTGFQPVGTLGYRLRSSDNTIAGRQTGDVGYPLSAAQNDDGCFNTNVACNCGGLCPNYRIWTEASSGTVGSSLGIMNGIGGACGVFGGVSTTDSTFVVMIGGVISLQASSPDRYGMDQTKQIVMCSDGLK